MTITAPQLAALALEVWRASGVRTERRRELLLMTYAETYFGIHLRWTTEQRATVDAARLLTRQRTRIDELTYEAQP